jgi:diadenosine tetraphosphatase ApaH/serine/threonine PP2A family protein phosphatase
MEFHIDDQVKFLFLGYIVGRGDFSFETLLIILILKIKYPQNVFVVRGNHETFELSSQFGFKEQIIEMYQKDSLFQEFVDLFSYLPLGAVIDDQYFCCHGGIGPSFSKLSQIEQIKRPVRQSFQNCPEKDIILDLLWSDPSERTSHFDDNSRGAGHIFGENAFEFFLKENSLISLIRGHTFQSEGFSSLWKGKLVSIFSCSNYCGVKNKFAVLQINSPSSQEIINFAPLTFVSRKKLNYANIPILMRSKSQKIVFDNGINHHKSSTNSTPRIAIFKGLKINKRNTFPCLSNRK